jgi:hypothetical protein
MTGVLASNNGRSAGGGGYMPVLLESVTVESLGSFDPRLVGHPAAVSSTVGCGVEEALSSKLMTR